MGKHEHHTASADSEGVAFGPFRLTHTPLRLWRGRREVKLQPRPLAVLHYLVEHAQAVVSREELLREVWKGTVVTATALQVCVRAVRDALGEEVEAPRYVATVGREGYRFIAPLTTIAPAVQGSTVKVQRSELIPNPQPLTPNLVGRDSELAQLHGLLDRTLRGERQLAFVTGEAGIGKTTLVDAFLNQPPIPSLWVGRGQCLEHYGESEAYLPVLEAVGQLCRGPAGADVLAALRRSAPTWLLHLPGVVDAAEREALARQGAGATRGQMLREMAEALEAVSAERGVVLVLEDLHVSDPSTVELLAYLAQRRAQARLLIIGTYRPVEVVVKEHPLRGMVHELIARGHGQTIALELLTEAEVAAYLRRRLATSTLPETLAGQIWQRTDGNALFMVSTVEYLLQQGWLAAEAGQWRLRGDLAGSGIPGTLQHLLAKQFDTLSAEQQRVLEVASVAGITFTSASVAAGIPTTQEAVEEVCEELAQRGQFIEEQGLAEWLDGTVSGQYGFRHILYQEVLYRRLGTGRRTRVHRAIGTREEAGYGERAGERAAELAMHFTQGRDLWRAVQYLHQAGQNALRRSAYVEALSHFTQGLTLLAAQSETPGRRQQELELQLGLGTAQMFTKGFAAPEVERAFLRAHALCQQIEDAPELFPAVAGLWTFYFARGELRAARPLAEQTLRLAHDADDPMLLAMAHTNMQMTLYFQGELTVARDHGEQALARFSTSLPVPLVLSHGPDPVVRARNCAASLLHALGYLDQARQQSRAALASARKLGHVPTVAATLQLAASIHGGCGEWAEMQARAAELVAFATAQGLPFWWAQGTYSHGIALAQRGDTGEGIRQIRLGLAVYRTAGSTVGITRILGWLAEACGHAGQIDEGFAALADAFALAEQNDERLWEAELYRREGELTLQRGAGG